MNRLVTCAHIDAAMGAANCRTAPSSYRLSIQGITGLLATGTMICRPPVMPDGIGTGMLNTGKPPKLAGAVRRMMLRRSSTVQSALRGALHGVAGRIKNS